MDVRVGLWRKLSAEELMLFELWCWRRLLRVPWTARRSNQSILKEISPGCSLEGLMLKLKLQYFGHIMRRVDSLEKTLMLGGTGARGQGDDRGWDGWMASLTRWTWVWVNSGSWLMDREAWHAVVHGVAKSRTQLSNWSDLIYVKGGEDRYTPRGKMERSHKDRVGQQRTKSLEEINLPTPWSQTFNFLNYEKINFCCLSWRRKEAGCPDWTNSILKERKLHLTLVRNSGLHIW